MGQGQDCSQGGSICWDRLGSKQTPCYCPWLGWLCGAMCAMLVERIKMFHCLLFSLEQGVDGVGDYPQVWTRNSPPGTSSVWSQGARESHLRMWWWCQDITGEVIQLRECLLHCPPDDWILLSDPPGSPAHQQTFSLNPATIYYESVVEKYPN